MFEQFAGECKCNDEYSIERHGDGHALYYGRCPHRHGYNLANIIDEAWNFDAEHLSKLLNLGNTVYTTEYPKYGSGYTAE